jgi:hypothetical protein
MKWEVFVDAAEASDEVVLKSVYSTFCSIASMDSR